MTTPIKRKTYKMTPVVKVMYDDLVSAAWPEAAAMLKRLDKKVAGLKQDVAYLLKQRDWRKCGPIARTPLKLGRNGKKPHDSSSKAAKGFVNPVFKSRA